MIVTLDWTFSHSRDWGSPWIPDRIDLKAMLRLAPEVLVRPAWLVDWARAGGPPDLTVPNLTPLGAEPREVLRRLRRVDETPPPSWEDLRWLREQWQGPFMLKGVIRVDDARRAVDAGFTAISVSNHGGNNLDTTPASIRALPAIAEAVGDQIEVLLDGGIRRGGDVVKALALGAEGGDDRARVPVGTCRGRPARRRERPRHHARRDRLSVARTRPREHQRDRARGRR